MRRPRRGGPSGTPPGKNEAEEQLGSGNGVGDKDPVKEKARSKEVNGGGKKAGGRVCDLELVNEQALQEALEKIPEKHAKEVAELLRAYRQQYERWALRLRHGFSVLFYGFGSKRTLLEDFASTALRDGAVVVLNGYLSSINLKQVICMVAEALCGGPEAPPREQNLKRTGKEKAVVLSSLGQAELLEYVRSEPAGGRHVYLVVHNVDGPDLRGLDAQLALAELAACPAVLLAASVDNINAPLLWDKQTARVKFNWWWEHAPTFAPYTAETAFVPAILVARNVERSTRGALVVLRSLTPNARSAFRLLADFQLSHSEEQGLAFQGLYMMCREKFLVSSETTLRSHLTEFRDHELVRTRRGADGQDVLFVPLPDEALAKLLTDIDSG